MYWLTRTSFVGSAIKTSVVGSAGMDGPALRLVISLGGNGGRDRGWNCQIKARREETKECRSSAWLEACCISMATGYLRSIRQLPGSQGPCPIAHGAWASRPALPISSLRPPRNSHRLTILSRNVRHLKPLGSRSSIRLQKGRLGQPLQPSPPKYSGFPVVQVSPHNCPPPSTVSVSPVTNLPRWAGEIDAGFRDVPGEPARIIGLERG